MQRRPFRQPRCVPGAGQESRLSGPALRLPDGRISPGAFLPPPLQARSAEARIILRAVRFWALRRRTGADGVPACVGLLGPGGVALAHLLQTWVTALGRSFEAMPCCAVSLSVDEALLLDLLDAAAEDRAADADLLMQDMFAAPVRARLLALAADLTLMPPGA
jgi:hypothetical protein